MPWVRLDDEFYAHPKVAVLSSDVMLACVGLHTLALCWCNHKLTDGIVPVNQVFRLAGDLSLALPSGSPHQLINELVRVGMWEVKECDEKGRALSYSIHDFLDYQPSRAQHEAEIRAKSEAGKRGMASRWGEKKPAADAASITPLITDYATDDITSPITDSLPGPVPGPVPSTRSPNPSEDTSGDVSSSRNTADDDGIDWEEQSAAPPRRRRSPTPYQKIVDLFNKCCPSLPAVQSIANDSRRKRLKAAHDALGMDGLEAFFRRVEASDFLAGRTKEQARFGIDWITKPGNFVKILEGNYDNRGTSVPAMNTNTQRALEIFRELKEAEDAGK